MNDHNIVRAWGQETNLARIACEAFQEYLVERQVITPTAFDKLPFEFQEAWNAACQAVITRWSTDNA